MITVYVWDSRCVLHTDDRVLNEEMLMMMVRGVYLRCYNRLVDETKIIVAL